MLAVARIDALRRVANLEVAPADESRLLFEDGAAELFRYTRIDRRLIDDDTASLQIAANTVAGRDHWPEVRRLVRMYGCRYRYDDERGLYQLRHIRRISDV